MTTNTNVVPDGAKGLDRQRAKGDPLKKFLQARRPNGTEPDRWINYRTEACVACNEAADVNAPAEVQARLREEYDAAVAFLAEHRPEILERLNEEDHHMPAGSHGTTEIWKEVFDGFYEVSSEGNVRRAKPGTATFIGRPVLPMCSANGYAQVALSSPSASRRAYVHHLVAEAFIGPRPEGHVVNHIDAVKTNNAASNLEYITARANALHACEVVRRRRGPTMPARPLKGTPRGDAHWSRRTPDRVARGERMGGSKLAANDVRGMHALRALGVTVQSIADVVGLSLGQASRILRGERWAHVK